MGIVLDKFRNDMKKHKDPRMSYEAQYGVRYPTGFLNFDFLNGSVVHVSNTSTGEEIGKYNSIGVLDGSIVFFVGRSGCGKTTLAFQMAGNITKQFKETEFYHEDIESGIASERKPMLLGMDFEEMNVQYIHRDAGITAENFFERVKSIHDSKISSRDELTYDTGYVDMENKKIYKMYPTVILLDSLALLMPESTTDADEVKGGMSTTLAAKTNAQIFRRLVPICKMANIILFVINHITDDPSIMPKKPQLAFLKMGEALPGGKESVYAATNIIRLDDAEKLKPEEGLKIKGAIVTVSLVKARSTFNGKTTKLVMNFDEGGFDPILSLYIMLKEHKALTGSAVRPSLQDRDDLKFTQSTFKKKLIENEDMQKVFAEECNKILETLITDPIYDKTQITITESISKTIFNMMPKLPQTV